MSTNTIEVGQPKNITATGDVTTTNTQLLGFYVNSTTAGTLAFKAGGSGGTVLTGTITPAIGWNELPIFVEKGLYVTVGGTIDVTFSYLQA